MRLAVSIAFTCLIALLSLIPGEPMEGDSQLVFLVAAIPSAFQNTMHLVLYFVLALSWSWALDPGHQRLLPAALLSTAYGIALEVAQLWIPGRFASLLDFALNTAGVLLAMLALAVWQQQLSQNA